MRPGTSSSAENMASLIDAVTIHPHEMRELWVPTKADPSKEWTVKGASSMHPSLRVAEGPAKIRNGKVKVYACTEGQEKVTLGVQELIAQLAAPTEEDVALQKMIRGWRMKSLRENTEALGREYCASLINLSEIGGQELHVGPTSRASNRSPSGRENIQVGRQSVSSNGNPAEKKENRQSVSSNGNPERSTGYRQSVSSNGNPEKAQRGSGRKEVGSNLNHPNGEPGERATVPCRAGPAPGYTED